jgi:hypothetical protein
MKRNFKTAELTHTTLVTIRKPCCRGAIGMFSSGLAPPNAVPRLTMLQGGMRPQDGTLA